VLLNSITFYDFCSFQASQEGGVGILATPGPVTFGGPTVGQKYKVC